MPHIQQYKKITRIEIGDNIFLLGNPNNYSDNSNILVINIRAENGIQKLPKEDQQEAFQRILRLTESCFNRQISIPAYWRPYNSGSRISFKSNSLASGERSRIEVERSPTGTRDIFVYYVGQRQKRQDLGTELVPLDYYSNAINSLKSLGETHQETDIESHTTALNNSINRETVTLEPVTYQHEYTGISFNDWYNSRLTNRQKQFIDYSSERSIRLVGSAGTGKTVALAARVVRILNEWNTDNTITQKNILVLTHNTSAVDNIDRLIRSMDSSGCVIDALDNGNLQISTLYELAYNYLGYQERQIEPIAIEGLKGRTEQVTVMGWVINQLRASDWKILKSECSDDFISWIELETESAEGRAFSFELLNEFTNFIDADGYNTSDKRQKYIDLKRRPNWLLNLPNPRDREIVLFLYDSFRNHLRDLGLIGTDQMISDFLGFLNSFGWDSIRKKRGFDIIFVDEMHLFNKQDQMILDHLQKDPMENPIISIAYDSKQSPRDSFRNLENYLSNPSFTPKGSTIGKIQKIELVDVFRYSPEILDALRVIDENFPAVDLEDGWPSYSGVSQQDHGEKPSITLLRDYKETYNRVFNTASIRQKTGKPGKSVAVLCCDPERFNEYVNAGAHKDLCLPVVERDQIERIRHAGRRFVLSMPEYVAGLQFDEVFLVDVNLDMAKARHLGTSALRKFISVVYLGASRAEKVLHFVSAADGGGYPKFIQQGISKGVLTEIRPDNFEIQIKGLPTK